MWDKHDGQLADSEPPITKKCRLAAQEAKEPESFANAKRRFSNRRVTASPDIASVFSNWHFAMLFTGVSGLLRPVSYTHLRSPRDGLLSRMPSSA